METVLGLFLRLSVTCDWKQANLLSKNSVRLMWLLTTDQRTCSYF